MALGLLDAGLALPGHLVFGLSAEVGYLLVPVVAQVVAGGTARIGVEGLWLGLQVGVGVAP